MNRFLDNSYIQATGNCLQRKATSTFEVETFGRFLAEVLIAEKFSFTGDQNGPVLPISLLAIDNLRSIIKEDIHIELIEFEEQSLNSACNNASNHLSDEIKFLSQAKTLEMPVNAQPNFRNNTNPHELLHEFLINPHISWQRKITLSRDLFKGNSSANIAPKVILTDSVIEVIAPKILKFEWDLAHTLHLSTAARMLTYDSLAKAVSSSYMPSSGRASLHIFKHEVQPVSVAELSDDDSSKPVDTNIGVLLPLINAVIRTSGGDPVKSLQLALVIREETKNLRKEFTKLQTDSSSDACLIDVQNLRKDYQDIISTFVKGTRPPSFVTAFKPSLVLFGIPSISIDVEKMGAWLDFKLKEKKVRRIATTYLKAKRLPPEDPLDLLRRSCIVTS